MDNEFSFETFLNWSHRPELPTFRICLSKKEVNILCTISGTVKLNSGNNHVYHEGKFSSILRKGAMDLLPQREKGYSASTLDYPLDQSVHSNGPNH